MEFKVLTPEGPEELQWSSLINRLDPENRDIHFLPEYGRIYQKTYGFEPYLAFYGNNDDFIIQPFVKRLLNGMPFLREQNIDELFYDISNPYGYGGPICSFHGKEIAGSLLNEFKHYFTNYCKEEKIASEFTSLHPLINNHKLIMDLSLFKLVKQKEIVYVELSGTEDNLWKGINRGNKSSINKAKKAGILVRKVDPVPENFNIFNKLYYMTMERNGASERWFFPEDYFRNCYELLGQNRVSLFFAFAGKCVASAYILMHDFSTIYYHFGGSDSRFYDLRPNNLLMYEVMLWAKKQGYMYYHLGGGVTSSPDDNLFRFKAGFSANRSPLYSYCRIHNSQIYEQLCDLKKNYEEKISGKAITSDYFPLYRR